jgi:hypothetical protein
MGFLLEQLDLDASALASSAQQSNSVTKLTTDSNQYSSAWRLYYDPFFTDQIDTQ